MKKIRFVNPIKECLEIQGKGYTVGLIATVIAILTLSVVAAVCKMPVCATVSGAVGFGAIIGFGWWFGITPIPEMKEEAD